MSRWRWIRIALLSGVVLGGPSDAGGAQQEQRAQPQPTAEEAVAACTALVRKESDERFGSRTSEFDAYVTSTGRVEYMGTTTEGFQFRKCMAARGFPLRSR